MAANASADVTRTAPGYRKRIRQWKRIRDTLEGEERIKERGTLYLPKPGGMKAHDYKAYVDRGAFYGVTDRTLRGLTGLVFRVKPAIELPTQIESLSAAATNEGFTMGQALREATREVLSLGRYGILVDMPPVPSINNVPYLATYVAEQIFRWEETTVNGIRRLTRVLVKEESETADSETTTVIRELALEGGIYVQRIFQEVESERHAKTAQAVFHEEEFDFISGSFEQVGGDIIPRRNGLPMDRIPFWFVNVFDMRPRADKPPMLDLANVNLAHWRNSADKEQSLFLTSQPTPYLFGVPKSDVPRSIGSGNIWSSERSDVQAGFLEFTGPGIESIRQAMLDKEDQMAALGARLIRDAASQSNVTAETTRLQARSETSILTAGVHTVEEAFMAASRFAAEWSGASPDQVDLTLNKDFVETRLDPQEITALVAAWQAGAYSRATLHEQLQRGEIVAPDRTVEDEVALIEEEGDDLRPPPIAVPGATVPRPESGGNGPPDDEEDGG